MKHLSILGERKGNSMFCAQLAKFSPLKKQYKSLMLLLLLSLYGNFAQANKNQSAMPEARLEAKLHTFETRLQDFEQKQHDL